MCRGQIYCIYSLLLVFTVSLKLTFSSSHQAAGLVPLSESLLFAAGQCLFHKRLTYADDVIFPWGGRFFILR